MCGRFVDPNLRSIGLDTSELKIDPFQRRHNVKPTEDVFIVANEPLKLMLARWWLIPSWFKGDDPKEWKASTFNARIEDARTRPAFRSAWRYGRCLIPVSGFYEWTGPKGSRRPNLIVSATNDEILWFAGLASRWHDQLTCTIMTRAANADIAAIHNRMPVILNIDERDAWLGGSDEQDIGAEASLRHYAVRPFGIADDGPDLLEPIDA